MEFKFKKEFIEKYSKLTDFDRYKESVNKFAKKSIRINTLKISINELKDKLEEQGWILNKTEFCDYGFYIEHKEERRDIGNTKEHELGYFFVQTSTSMIPALMLNPNENDLVLDLCASPGGKTSHLAQIMNNKGLITANELDNLRLKTLIINLGRLGILNTVVTNNRGERIKGLEFDKILIDAPCSGSGMIKGKTKLSFEMLKMWNAKRIKRYASLQRRLIINGYNLLKSNGTLVYSTCSLEPEENECVVDYLINNYNCRLIDIKRIWPQDYETEGFFAAKIRKN